MGLAAPKNTLSHQLARPLCSAADMSWVPVAVTAKRANELLNVYKNTKKDPVEEALRFYLLQHAMAIVRQRKELDEPLGEYEEIAELYHSECSEIAMRIFLYLFIITTREFRHGAVGCHATLGTKFGSEIVEFRTKIKNNSCGGVVPTLFNKPPEMTLGKFVEAVEWTFNHGKFGGGYGGKPWGNITSVLRRYVYGEFTAEMMLDTAFTLAHNNGTMFNKGYGWNHPHKSALLTVLDVQASGQIPNLCWDYRNSAVPNTPDIPASVMALYDKLTEIIGPEFKKYVDWCKVKVDAPGHREYAAQIKYQVTNHGKSEYAGVDAKNEVVVNALANDIAAAKAAQKAKTNDGKIQVDIWNTLKVEEGAR